MMSQAASTPRRHGRNRESSPTSQTTPSVSATPVPASNSRSILRKARLLYFTRLTSIKRATTPAAARAIPSRWTRASRSSGAPSPRNLR